MKGEEKDGNVIREQETARRKIVEQFVAYRKTKNMTQEKLASLMGIKRPSISRFETGQYNPSLDLLVKMAECMDLRVEVRLIEKERGDERDE